MIPFAKILDTAKKLGFTGDANDEKIVRAFVADALETKRLAWPTHGGQPVTRALIVAQPDPNTVVVTDDGMGAGAAPSDGADAQPQRSIDPADLNLRIAAGVEQAMRKFAPKAASNFDPHATAGASDGQPQQVSVRSHGEIIFDERKRQNKQVFSDYQTAMLFRDALVADLSYNRKLGFDSKDAEAARNSLVSRGVIDKDGAVKRAYATFPQAAGGALTSPAFLPDLLKNVNKWGIGRQLAKVVPMQNDVVNRPKHSGSDVTVTYQTDNTATTTSTAAPYSSLNLQAKTGIILQQVSRNLMNDSGIDVAQDFAEDITRAFAKAEDKALLVGDGTTTYGGMKGFTQRFADLGLSANGGGLLYQAASSMSGYTDANLSSLISLLPDYAWDNACFVCSPAALALIFNRLSATAPTGTSLADFSTLNFKTRSQYRGLPIMVSNAMNSTDAAAANTIDVLFGDFSRAAMIGDRLSLDIALDESYGFNTYSVYIRGVFRHDVNVHDFGTTTVAGPVVAMSQS